MWKVKYDPVKSDIFSMGICLFILVAGEMPFSETNQSDETFVRFSQDPKAFLQHPDLDLILGSDPDLISLLSGMLHPDPENRMSLEEIKGSEWFKGRRANIKEIRRELIDENGATKTKMKTEKVKRTRKRGFWRKIKKYFGEKDDSLNIANRLVNLLLSDIL